MIENENGGPSGALIDGKDEFLSHLNLFPLCARRSQFSPQPFRLGLRLNQRETDGHGRRLFAAAAEPVIFM
jgi:hypothetical protein